MEGSLFRHLATPLELRLVVDHLDEDDAFAFASTCRAFRAATCLAGSAAARFGERGIRTSMADVWSSTARLRWAVGLGYEMHVYQFARAARMGHLEVLQWARANGCEWNEWTCSAAAEGGHLEVLQWARANGCKWNEDTCSYAAAAGHLEVLQWARANGCDWDGDTCALAVEGGHLEVLQWARANGCPWNKAYVLLLLEREEDPVCRHAAVEWVTGQPA